VRHEIIGILALSIPSNRREIVGKRLVVRLLGGVEIARGKTRVKGFESKKAVALFCYLALDPREHSRDALAAVFWGDLPDAAAKKNLRDVLSTLQRVVKPYLLITRESVAFNSASPHWIDVVEFERQIADSRSLSADSPSPPAISHLLSAISHYRSDFMEGFVVRDAQPFEEWMLARRERLKELAAHAFQELSAQHLARGNLAEAEESARGLLRLQPWQELAHRQLMLLLALRGDRAGALAQYETLRRVLADELEVAPLEETTALSRRIATGELAELVAPSASEQIARVAVSPLVGRERELSQLQDAWRAAMQGKPQIVLIEGEAGIGKTRLAQEFMDWAAAQQSAVASAQSYLAEQGLAFRTVTRWLRSESVRATLPLLEDVWLTRLAWLLPEILAKRPTLPAPPPIADPAARELFFQALARACLIAKRALVLFCDDLHWCDSSTLDWIEYLLRFDARARLLVVATARSEELAVDDNLQSRLTRLCGQGLLSLRVTPQRLSRDETATLAGCLTPEPAALGKMESLYSETEGNPLFIVESVRAGFLQQTAPMLPTTVQAVIESRLRQLSAPARQLAMLAATIGRDFAYDVLAQASGESDRKVLKGLDELCRRGILREQGAANYDFSHAKIREVAYAQIGAARRRVLHRRVAQVLEQVYRDDFDRVGGLVAEQYERAHMPKEATLYYSCAAAGAQRLFANRAAESLLTHALTQLKTLPETRERAEHELDLQNRLGLVLTIIEGLSSPAAFTAFERARALAERLGDARALFQALAGSLDFYPTRLGLVPACQVGERLVAIARDLQDERLQMQARVDAARMLFWRGDFYEAEDHLDQAQVSEGKACGEGGLLRRVEPEAFYLSYKGLIECLRGFPDRGLKRVEQSIALCHRRALLYGERFAISFLTYALFLRGEWPALQNQTEQQVAFCREHHMPHWIPGGISLGGYALVQQGRLAEGIAQIQEGIRYQRELGNQLGISHMLGLLADAYGRSGRFEEGLALVAAAEQLALTRSEGYALAELYRLNGELLLRQSPQNQNAAEALFQRALEIAQQQGARWFELRAATSVARLLPTDQARARLAEICAGFTEGFDTTAWREAQVVLTA
jgi:DNA-binding SARP family transcriptional activator/predicted ATPase